MPADGPAYLGMTVANGILPQCPPAFADLTDEEKMMGEYRVMGVYP